MIEAKTEKKSVICKDGKNSFTYSSIKRGANDENLYKLGKALNSVQNFTATSIIKVVDTSLTHIIEI